MSREELGEKTCFSAGAIQNFESGFNPIYYENAVKFAEILDIDTEELMTEYTRFCRKGYGKRIARIRNAYEVPQWKFGEMVGVDRTTTSIWEAEVTDIHPSEEAYEKLKQLAADKGLDVLKLIEDPDFYPDEYQEFVKSNCGKKIRYIRAAYGVYMQEFGLMVGLTSGDGSVSLWESDKGKSLRVNFKGIKRLAEAKGIDLKKLNEDPDYYEDDYSRFRKGDVAKKIPYLRVKSDLYQEEFGVQVGATGKAVSEWEAGNCIPTRPYFEGIKRFADANGFDLDELNRNPDIYRDRYEEICDVPGYGEKIKAVRNKMSLSLKKFGKLIGVSDSSVLQWETELRGRRPNRKTFERILAVAAKEGIDI